LDVRLESLDCTESIDTEHYSGIKGEGRIMMRNLVVLGCAGLLAFGLSLSGFAGGLLDTDSDGVSDPSDNCVDVPNGPSGSTDSCDSQEDGDADLGDPDGYGNPCDTDINGDGSTGGDDLSATLAAVKAGSTDGKFDFNCDGSAGGDDLSRSLADTKAGATPGPSGKACAGSPPCP
jgi:hypothetical protein